MQQKRTHHPSMGWRLCRSGISEPQVELAEQGRGIWISPAAAGLEELPRLGHVPVVHVEDAEPGRGSWISSAAALLEELPRLGGLPELHVEDAEKGRGSWSSAAVALLQELL